MTFALAPCTSTCTVPSDGSKRFKKTELGQVGDSLLGNPAPPLKRVARGAQLQLRLAQGARERAVVHGGGDQPGLQLPGPPRGGRTRRPRGLLLGGQRPGRGLHNHLQRSAGAGALPDVLLGHSCHSRTGNRRPILCASGVQSRAMRLNRLSCYIEWIEGMMQAVKYQTLPACTWLGLGSAPAQRASRAPVCVGGRSAR